jgi:AcrR family transcriptional regulator
MEGPIHSPRRRSQHGNLPNALRAAARALLDEAGADAVGLREASRRVGVSATAAYRHFNNKQDLLASVAAEGFRELAAAMETGAIDSDPLRAVGLAYVDFALQNRGLFRLMFGPVLVERAKYPDLNEAANAVFNLLRRVEVSANVGPHEDHAAGMAAWGLVHGLSSLILDGLVSEISVKDLAFSSDHRNRRFFAIVPPPPAAPPPFAQPLREPRRGPCGPHSEASASAPRPIAN